MGLNLGLDGEDPATDCLGHGTACYYLVYPQTSQMTNLHSAFFTATLRLVYKHAPANKYHCQPQAKSNMQEVTTLVIRTEYSETIQSPPSSSLPFNTHANDNTDNTQWQINLLKPTCYVMHQQV
jgi:hypothetical protein